MKTITKNQYNLMKKYKKEAIAHFKALDLLVKNCEKITKENPAISDYAFSYIYDGMDSVDLDETLKGLNISIEKK